MQLLTNFDKKIKNLMWGLLVSVSLSTAILPSVAFADKPASETQTQTVQDTFGRDTPRGSIQGLLRALAQGDNELASHYLALTYQKNAEKYVQ